MHHFLEDNTSLEGLAVAPAKTKTVEYRGGIPLPETHDWRWTHGMNVAENTLQTKFPLVFQYWIEVDSGLASEWLAVEEEIASLKASPPDVYSQENIPCLQRCIYSDPNPRRPTLAQEYWYTGSRNRHAVCIAGAKDEDTFRAWMLLLPGPNDPETLQGGRLADCLKECQIPTTGVRNHSLAAFSDDAGVLAIVGRPHYENGTNVYLFDF